jgi:phosphohistidine phosphatase
MDIYVVRHGIAAPASKGQDDAERALTEEGRERLARAVRGLHRLGVNFERVIHSPWKRAQQTARMLEPITYGAFESSPLLTKEPSQELLKLLAKHADEGPLALVGHQPWLGQLVAWLVVDARERGDSFDLKKGGAIWLDGEPKPGRMRVRGSFTPRVLRSVRR